MHDNLFLEDHFLSLISDDFVKRNIVSSLLSQIGIHLEVLITQQIWRILQFLLIHLKRRVGDFGKERDLCRLVFFFKGFLDFSTCALGIAFTLSLLSYF